MMTSERPEVSETGRYTVMQTCLKMGIHRNTLRDWTDRGYIRCGFSRIKARKFYEGREILRCWQARM